MSQSGSIDGAGGGAQPVVTINGDTGSITGEIVTIFANRATRNAGASVQFNNTGTTSTLNVTDSVLFNTHIGRTSGNLTETGASNTSVGNATLTNLTSGTRNNAFGVSAGTNLRAGARNIAIGTEALVTNQAGANNTAVGDLALRDSTGNGNSAVGSAAGATISTGINNVLVGLLAGASLTTESNNVIIGSNVASDVGTSNGIIIGNASTTSCKIRGIGNVAVTTPQPVYINPTTGQLGSTTDGYFFGYLSATTANVTGDRTPFTPIMSNKTVDTNNAYNTTTGVYTAPATGNYYFNLQATFVGLGALYNEGTIILTVAGIQNQCTYSDPFNLANKFNGFASLSQSGIFPMTVGQAMTFTIIIGNSTKTVSLQGLGPNGYTTTLTIFKI